MHLEEKNKDLHNLCIKVCRSLHGINCDISHKNQLINNKVSLN